MTPRARSTPYVGPRPFETGERLYGRDQEVMELLDLLIAERIVLLYSPSGAGKTSLVQAALVPEMEREGFKVLPIMRVSLVPPPTQQLPEMTNRYVLSLLLSLEKDLLAEQQAPVAELASMELGDYLDRRPAAADRPDAEVLIFDQFEEILTVNPTDRAAKEAFFTQVGAALRHRHRWALFAMREEYLAGLDPYLRPIPTRLSTTFRVELLQEEAARLAIQRPAREVGVDFTDAAAGTLVNDLRMVRVQQPEGTTEEQLGLYVEPVQLQVVCRRLWEKLPADAALIGEADVEAVGDVDSALSGYYAECVASIAKKIGVSERTIREWFDRSLITEQGIRGQVLHSPEQSQGLENQAIWPLVDDHLVRAEKRRGATWFELAHDRLINPVRKNNAEWYQANLSALQRQAALWDEQHRSPGLLLRGEALEEADRWAAAHQDELTPPEREFLAACQEAHVLAERERRQGRRIRRLAIGASIIGAIAVGFFLLALDQLLKARQANAIANSRQLAAQALTRLDDQLDLALLLSVEAYRVSDTVEARSSLLTGLQYRPHLATILGGRQESRIQQVTFSQEGKKLAWVRSEGLMTLWDLGGLDERRPIHPLRRELNLALDESIVAFDPSGRLLAIADESRLGMGKVFLWDVTEGRRLDPPLAPFAQGGGNVKEVTFSSDGKLLAVLGCRYIGDQPDAECGETSEIHLWSIASGQWLKTPIYDSGHFNSLAFSPDNQTLAAINMNGDKTDTRFQGGNSVILWNVHTLEPRTLTLPGSTRLEKVLAFSPDNQTLAAINVNVDNHNFQGGDSVILWNVHTLEPRILTLPDPTSLDKVLVFSPDGRFLALRTVYDSACHRLYTVLLLNVTTPLSYDSLCRESKGEVSSLAFSPDGRSLAVGGRDKSIVLWDVATRKPLGEPLLGHTAEVSTLVFSPNGNGLASLSNDNSIILWNLTRPQSLGQFLAEHKGEVTGVAFSSDGKRLASTGVDQTVRLWDLTDDQPRSTILNSSPLKVSGVVFGPDDKWLATGSEDQTVILWDVTLLQLLDQPSKVDPTLGVPVTEETLSPNRQMLASGRRDNSRDEMIRLWEVTPRQPIGPPLQGHTDLVERLAFSPDGRKLASAGRDGRIIIWDMHPQSWRDRACHIVSRNFTYEEWKQYRGDVEYRVTCPDLPIHPSVREAAASALILKGMQLAVDGQKADAVRHFRRASEQDPSSKLNGLAAKALGAKGGQMARDGEVLSAITLFEIAQQLTPGSAPNPEARARRLAAQGPSSAVKERHPMAKSMRRLPFSKTCVS